MQEMIINKEELNKIIEIAFSKGEQWGVTYSGWFNPTESEHKEQQEETKQEILEYIKKIDNEEV